MLQEASDSRPSVLLASSMDAIAKAPSSSIPFDEKSSAAQESRVSGELATFDLEYYLLNYLYLDVTVTDRSFSGETTCCDYEVSRALPGSEVHCPAPFPIGLNPGAVILQLCKHRDSAIILIPLVDQLRKKS